MRGRGLRFVEESTPGGGWGGWSPDGLPSFAANVLCVLGQVTLVPRASASFSVLRGQDLVVAKTHPG